MPTQIGIENSTVMVFLAITPAGLADALRAAKPHDFVWCGSDAITEGEYAALKRQNLSRFIYELSDRHLAGC
ncbi:hypothetical protein [Eleftheria terrae]|uniref:hypothetical protein n=1 Tax=Eleftheria terrae TaxID=1597781 RepID=UPI00263B18B0|nr:hypothetical protein [Eleftheria terrae]WKB56024.1 hypothetical protein N7L95_28570 [Eleftheria terrae]